MTAQTSFYGIDQCRAEIAAAYSQMTADASDYELGCIYARVQVLESRLSRLQENSCPLKNSVNPFHVRLATGLFPALRQRTWAVANGPRVSRRLPRRLHRNQELESHDLGSGASVAF